MHASRSLNGLLAVSPRLTRHSWWLITCSQRTHCSEGPLQVEYELWIDVGAEPLLVGSVQVVDASPGIHSATNPLPVSCHAS